MEQFNEWVDRIVEWCQVKVKGRGWGIVAVVSIITVAIMLVASFIGTGNANTKIEELETRLGSEMVTLQSQVVDSANEVSKWEAYQIRTWADLASQVNAAVASIPTVKSVASLGSEVDKLQSEYALLSASVNLLQTEFGVAESQWQAGGFSHSLGEMGWYRLQCALSDPKMIRMSLAKGPAGGSFTVMETIYLKDYANLCLMESDFNAGKYITGGVLNGHILSLPPGTYYHYGQSGIMYVLASDLNNIKYDPVERYYRRLGYILSAEPDIIVRTVSSTTGIIADHNIAVGPNGSVISYGASGGGFRTASLVLDEGNGVRAMNGMGTGTTMTPLTTQMDITRLRVNHVGEGFSFFKVHHCPDWW